MLKNDEIQQIAKPNDQIPSHGLLSPKEMELIKVRPRFFSKDSSEGSDDEEEKIQRPEGTPTSPEFLSVTSNYVKEEIENPPKLRSRASMFTSNSGEKKVTKPKTTS